MVVLPDLEKVPKLQHNGKALDFKLPQKSLKLKFLHFTNQENIFFFYGKNQKLQTEQLY